MGLATTYNKIIAVARSFADRHAQIKEFQSGRDLDEIDWKKKENGVYAFFDITQARPSRGSLTYSISYIFMDMKNKGEDLQNGSIPTIKEVYNDTLLIALDFTGFMYGIEGGGANGSCDPVWDLDLDFDENSITIEPFEFYGKHEYVGQALTMDIVVPFTFDYTDIPIDVSGGSPVPPTGLIDITVRDTANALVEIFSNLNPVTQELLLANAYLITDAIQVVNEGDGQVGIIQVA